MAMVGNGGGWKGSLRTASELQVSRRMAWRLTESPLLRRLSVPLSSWAGEFERSLSSRAVAA